MAVRISAGEDHRNPFPAQPGLGAASPGSHSPLPTQHGGPTGAGRPPSPGLNAGRARAAQPLPAGGAADAAQGPPGAGGGRSGRGARSCSALPRRPVGRREDGGSPAGPAARGAAAGPGRPRAGYDQGQLGPGGPREDRRGRGAAAAPGSPPSRRRWASLAVSPQRFVGRAAAAGAGRKRKRAAPRAAAPLWRLGRSARGCGPALPLPPGSRRRARLRGRREPTAASDGVSLRSAEGRRGAAHGPAQSEAAAAGPDLRR